MTKRKEWNSFYCTEDIDNALRECDNKRAAKLTEAWWAAYRVKIQQLRNEKQGLTELGTDLYLMHLNN